LCVAQGNLALLVVINGNGLSVGAERDPPAFPVERLRRGLRLELAVGGQLPEAEVVVIRRARREQPAVGAEGHLLHGLGLLIGRAGRALPGKTHPAGVHLPDPDLLALARAHRHPLAVGTEYGRGWRPEHFLRVRSLREAFSARDLPELDP